MHADARVVMDLLFRRERSQILATLIRLTGDFTTAEDALQESFAEALTVWPRDGVPPNPAAWITTVARRRAVDVIRRAHTFRKKTDVIERLQLAEPTSHEPVIVESEGDGVPRDDRLRLLFTCCHPALSLDSQVALTLRMVAGLTTREIARAFLSTDASMAQRLVRAKEKIRRADIPFRVPAANELPDRLEAVLEVIYLVFNESYASTSAAPLVRQDLCDEAIRLGRLLDELLPAQPEVEGLLALMLLHSARNPARVDADGQLVTLEVQNRALWDRARIEAGRALTERALKRGRVGVYQIQAAIAALHAEAATPDQTDWRQIAALYRLLLYMRPSPVVELNHAVAVGMAAGPAAGLELIAQIEAHGELLNYHLLPVARAELLVRNGEAARAAECFRAALLLCTNDAERAHLTRRLASIGQNTVLKLD
ncbi:MAG TPA: RNA polymerase sigma factor [Longimicrobiales bacterium]|nr:RNA polymerase sigma factor [Longimicrobiales bacterium]